jgi:hypothetical protein
MFHAVNPTLFGRPEIVVSRSFTLSSTLFQLRGATSSLSNEVPEAFSAASRLLSDFSGQLAGYFEARGSGSYFDAIAEECPSLEPRARELQHELGDLKECFATAAAFAAGRDKICTTGLSTRIDHLLDAFERHERAERELLQDFFLRAGESAEKRDVDPSA